jgi:hypothetical protein
MAAQGWVPYPGLVNSLLREWDMRTLWQGLGRLSLWKKVIVGILLLVVVLTWISVCVVLASYLA